MIYDHSKISQVFLGIILVWAIIFIFYHCHLDGAKFERSSLNPISNIRLVHNDLAHKYKRLADVPEKIISDLKALGFTVIELDHRKDGEVNKIIIVYEEL